MTPVDQRPNALDKAANREPMVPGQDRWLARAAESQTPYWCPIQPADCISTKREAVRSNSKAPLPSV